MNLNPHPHRYREVCRAIAPDLQSMTFGSEQGSDPKNGNAESVKVLTGVEPKIKPETIDQTRKLCVGLEQHKVVKLEQIQTYLTGGADLNTEITLGDLRGCNPLHSAAISGNGEAVAAIIATGKVNNINVVNGHGFTPLALLCGARAEDAKFIRRFDSVSEERNGRRVGLEALLGAGANQHMMDSNSWKPIHHAARHNFPGLIELLVEQDRFAGIAGIAGIESAALSTDIINCQDRQGNTPLHIAASNNQLHAVEVLIKLGANVNALNKANQKPLHRLCMVQNNNNTYGGKVACLLLEKDPDHNCQDKHGFNWLEYACRNGMVYLLVYVASVENSVLHNQENKITVDLNGRCNVNTGKKSSITRSQFERVITLLKPLSGVEVFAPEQFCEEGVRDSRVQNEKDTDDGRMDVDVSVDQSPFLPPSMQSDWKDDNSSFE
ncbi:ankyrin repeat domain-containing protein [Endozoicomonas sp. ALB091]|uniref:ankyrin repeat domain-containing protein n=1 Tax=Endozoicomonas sp. ALB091 TaxID=3403073 RepID=UPI003BB808A6